MVGKKMGLAPEMPAEVILREAHSAYAPEFSAASAAVNVVWTLANEAFYLRVGGLAVVDVSVFVFVGGACAAPRAPFAGALSLVHSILLIPSAGGWGSFCAATPALHLSSGGAFAVFGKLPGCFTSGFLRVPGGSVGGYGFLQPLFGGYSVVFGFYF
jgi:hypothetical protein